ncbi:hypothetical protein Glove_362g22 [Diversispora epigaea]|uniref:Uncharacterized protein n=1 Tax=Diversispora epigaea TaxID=1348612 RepID=A0A397HED7_9GLOM|nr:hypothetical protein Glove_362g22 [Diversispora epigaea]
MKIVSLEISFAKISVRFCLLSFIKLGRSQVSNLTTIPTGYDENESGLEPWEISLVNWTDWINEELYFWQRVVSDNFKKQPISKVRIINTT